MRRIPTPSKRVTAALAVGATTLALLAATWPAAASSDPTIAARPSGCQLANGVKHVIQIQFDNVHLTRDNPNVPSDLQQMPHLYDFLKDNGVVLATPTTTSSTPPPTSSPTRPGSIPTGPA
jgi:hypothetical protein